MKALTLAFAALFGLTSIALALEKPQDGARIVLTVSGDISETNGDGVAEFDYAMLQALDWREIETFTSFTEGPQTFAGPTLVSLLDALGVEDGTLTASAINDYSITIPVEHAAQHDVLLAMEQNGKRMRVRDKGPIWVVYPLSEAEAANRPFDGEMIWQLVRLDVSR